MKQRANEIQAIGQQMTEAVCLFHVSCAWAARAMQQFNIAARAVCEADIYRKAGYPLGKTERGRKKFYKRLMA